MNYFGNILTVYDIAGIKTVAQLLSNKISTVTNKATEFTEIGNTFFVKTWSVNEATEIIAQISALNIKFTFVHLDIPTGSYIQTLGLNAPTITELRNIINDQYQY